MDPYATHKRAWYFKEDHHHPSPILSDPSSPPESSSEVTVPFYRFDSESSLDGQITWKQRQEKRRLKFERAIEIMATVDIPAQTHAIRYLEHLYRRHCKANTIQNVRITIFLFLRFIKQIDLHHLEQITRKDLAAFIEHEQDRGLKPKTIRTRIQDLYAFFRFLEPDNIVHPDVLDRRIRVKQPQMLPRAIAAQDISQLFSVITNIRDRALMLVLLRTGIRIGELLNLMINDVDFQNRSIKIYEGEKNSVGRVVYLSDDALAALTQWFRIRNPSKAYIFYGHHGPLGYTGARNLFVKYVEKAGLSHKGYSLHCLRHTFATDLLNAGMRIECLQQLLGHSKLDVTRIYAKLSDQTREQEYFKAMAKIEQGAANDY